LVQKLKEGDTRTHTGGLKMETYVSYTLYIFVFKMLALCFCSLSRLCLLAGVEKDKKISSPLGPYRLWDSPVSCPKGTGGSLPGGKVAVAWIRPLTSTYVEIENARSYISTPPYVFISWSL